jgi:hypothetical protein
MTAISGVAGSVGAGVRQMDPPAGRLTEQPQPKSAADAALTLIRAVLSDAGTMGRDLDVLA